VFFNTSNILFFLDFNKSTADFSKLGAITTSQKSLLISLAVSKSIFLFEIKTPPKAETGSPAKASL